MLLQPSEEIRLLLDFSCDALEAVMRLAVELLTGKGEAA